MVADGIPYALQGWAYDDGRSEIFTLTLSDGSQANLTLSQLLDRAKTGSKLDNFVYLKALQDAGLLIEASHARNGPVHDAAGRHDARGHLVAVGAAPDFPARRLRRHQRPGRGWPARLAVLHLLQR